MKIDKLGKLSFDRANGGNYTEDMSRGKLTGLMIRGNVDPSDKITIKVRTKDQTYVLANGLRIQSIMSLSDREYGPRGTKAIANNLSILYGELDAHIDFTIVDSRFDDLGVSAAGYMLNLGHISLINAEFEFSYEAIATGGSVSQSIDFYTVYEKVGPDTFVQYDETKDFDSTHHQVKEVHFLSTNVLVDKAGTFVDLDFQIDLDDDTIIYDCEGILVASSLLSRMEMPDPYNVRLYSEPSPLPSTVRVKVTGADSTKHSLLFVKEIVPKQVSDSTKNAVKELREKVEKLERSNAEMAKRYRHAGKIDKSEDMAAVEKQMEDADGQKEGETES